MNRCEVVGLEVSITKANDWTAAHPDDAANDVIWIDLTDEARIFTAVRLALNEYHAAASRLDVSSVVSWPNSDASLNCIFGKSDDQNLVARRYC